MTTVLVVTAHPDDVDFGAAGTVATFVASGVRVSYCVVTDGDAGGSDTSLSRSELATVRQKEQRAAAAEVGVSDLTFLGHRDGHVVCNDELRRDITRVIRRVRPERVVTQSPERVWERLFASHPDHLAAGEAVVCAIYPDSRNPFAFPELLDEGLAPHTVRELWLMAGPDADVAVDITDAFPKKLAALCRHESQIGDPDALEHRLRDWAGSVAQAAGLAGGRLAEAFRVVPTA